MISSNSKYFSVLTDLKPENVLCLSREGNRIKLIDFGMARRYEPTKKLQILFGTAEFVGIRKMRQTHHSTFWLHFGYFSIEIDNFYDYYFSIIFNPMHGTSQLLKS